MKRLVIFAAFLFAVVPTAWPQTPAVQPSPGEAPAATVVPHDLPIVPATPEQAKELAKWLKDARAWQKWDQQFRSVPQWTTWSGKPAERRRQPETPAWLDAACDDFSEARIAATQLLVDACELKKDLARNYDDVIAARIAQERAAQQMKDEALDKSSFLSKLHFDGPYIMAQSDGWRVFSYFGLHMTLFDIKKRVYVWLPPGFSLVSIPTGDGRRVTPAYGAGLSVRWFDFRVPGAPYPSTMYFNLSQFFIQDSTVPGVNSRLTMMGLSFTAKKPK